MNFKTQREDEIIPDITPLIDVVFLLLIFFMVSTTFEHDSEINLTLPSSSKEVIEGKIDMVNVKIDAQGDFYVDDNALTDTGFETIKQALSEAAINLHEPSIIISADAKASHQSVIRVMDAARQLKLVKITFATQALTAEK